MPDCLSGRGGFDPRLRRQTVGVWCNGNTVDFDSTALGSIPGTPAILKHITHQVSGGGSPVKGATPTKSLIVCFNMVAIP